MKVKITILYLFFYGIIVVMFGLLFWCIEAIVDKWYFSLEVKFNDISDELVSLLNKNYPNWRKWK